MTDIDIDDKTLHDGLAWGSVGFGALATLAPRVFEKVYGLQDGGELRVMCRLWGTRTAFVGAVLLLAEDEYRPQLAKMAAAMNVADAVFIATAGSEVKKSSRVAGALTSAAFAVGFGSLLRS